MDTQILHDLHSTALGLSAQMGLHGGFSGREIIRQEVEAALSKRPLSDAQKGILRDASTHTDLKLSGATTKAFASSAKHDVTAEHIAHNFTDAIAKKITNISLMAELGISDAEDTKTLYENAVQLRNLTSLLQTQIPVITGHKTESGLRSESPVLGRAASFMHHSFLPKIESHIQQIEHIHGKMDVAPLPTGGAEYFKPFDIRTFNQAKHEPATTPQTPSVAAKKSLRRQ